MIVSPTPSAEECAAILVAFAHLACDRHGSREDSGVIPAWRRAARESDASFDELRLRRSGLRVR